MHADHKANYGRIGRWILAGAFLAGMIVLNVFKEELPEERQSRFWAFAVGLASYGALLLIQ